jgi:hypothetical protein
MHTHIAWHNVMYFTKYYCPSPSRSLFLSVAWVHLHQNYLECLLNNEAFPDLMNQITEMKLENLKFTYLSVVMRCIT